MACELAYLQKIFKKTRLQALARDKNAYMYVYLGIYIYLAMILIYFWRSLPLLFHSNLEVLSTPELTETVRIETWPADKSSK